MSRDAANGLLRRAPPTPRGVRQVAVPPAARALSTLSHIDYADAFLVDPGPLGDRTPEQCFRAILEGAPAITRSALHGGWSALGLRLGSPRSNRYVLGWEVRRSASDFALLGADSRLGLPAELLLKRERKRLLFATFVQHENSLARALWAGVEHAHRPIVRYLLEQARRREWRRGEP